MNVCLYFIIAHGAFPGHATNLIDQSHFNDASTTVIFNTVAELIDALMHLMLQSHKDNGGQLQHCQTCNEPRAINFQS